MDRKKFVSILAFVMALIMILSLFVSVLPAAFAYEEEEPSELDELEQEKEEYTSKAAEAKERVDELRSEKAGVLEQKAALEVEKKAAEAAIEIVNQQIAVYDMKIAEKAIEVQQAKTVEDEQLRRYRTRVRAMEEDGGFNILILLARSESLGELLAALDDAGDIMESDKALERQYREAREESERVKGEYEQLRLDCEAKQGELLAQKTEIEKQLAEADALMAELEEDIEVALVAYRSAQQAEEQAAQEILEMIARYYEQKRREAEEAKTQPGENYDNSGEGDIGVIPVPPPISTPSPVNTPAPVATPTPEEPAPTETPQQPDPPAEPTEPGEGGEGGEGGEVPATPAPTPAPTPVPTPAPTPEPTPSGPANNYFIWPVPCSKRITSRFGNRIDPFTGAVRYHSGIDIDGYHNDGQPVIASDGGTVVAATYNDGYGNYVIIDHGNGYMTLYGHMSGLAVGYGDVIGQGFTVGYLGATGRATGTHCHFEVILNGNRIDPEQFFSGMTYWNC